MIRIKDYIFNENKLDRIMSKGNCLFIEVGDIEYIVTKAIFDDIEWNYDKEVLRKALDNDIDLRIKIQELEEKNKTFEDYNKDLNNQLDKLEEENKKLKEIESMLNNSYENAPHRMTPLELDILKILKGEENDNN